jgi:hypothetical protein
MNSLQAAGARDDKESRWAPIFTNRFFLGLWTNRNPLRAPTGVIYENYYRLGGTDALIAGTNAELSNRLTICRRPGNTAGLSPYISSANVPGLIDTFYSFHEIGGNVRVMADSTGGVPGGGGFLDTTNTVATGGQGTAITTNLNSPGNECAIAIIQSAANSLPATISGWTTPSVTFGGGHTLWIWRTMPQGATTLSTGTTTDWSMVVGQFGSNGSTPVNVQGNLFINVLNVTTPQTFNGVLSGVTAGHSMLIVFTTTAGTGATDFGNFTVTDTQGNAWYQVGLNVQDAGGRMDVCAAMFICPVISASGSVTVSLTIGSGGTVSSNSNVTAILSEISGITRITAPSVFLVGGQVNGQGTGSQGVIPIISKSTGATQGFFQGIGQSLYFGDGVDQLKWLDYGAGNPGNSFSTVTATALTSNVATITAANSFAVGQTVIVSGTTNGSGVFNGTFQITAANSAQFQYKLNSVNVASANEANGFASGVWNWSITAPSSAPTLTVTVSGSAATVWQANTVFSTMGLIYDSGTNSVQQLISVNATGGNTTQFGTSGNGEPAWNQTPGGTTADTTGGGNITWTNWGPVPAWMAHTVYNNASLGGTLANPSQIYDPTSKVLAFNAAPGNSQGTSGSVKPTFVASQGANQHDPLNQDSPPAVKWYSMFPAPSRWKANTSYPAFLGNDTAGTCVVEPVPLPAPNNQTVFMQISNGGTSGSGYTPAFSATAGNQVTDNQLTWQSCGSASWVANTVYTPWSSFPSPFSAIKDSNGNLQVCQTTTGNAQSGATQPLQAWQAGHVYSNGNTISDSNGRLQTVTTGGTSGVTKTLTTSVLASGVATYTTSAVHGYAAGQFVTITGSSHNAIFNVTNAIILAVPTTTTFTISLPYDDIGSAADTGTSKAGPTWATVNGNTTTDGTVTWTAGTLQKGWGTNYQDITNDGNVTWVCVGGPLTWATNTIYHLPSTGFAPPSGSEPFGGSEVISGTAPTQFVQAVRSSGKSGGGGSPTFSTATGNRTLDNTIIWQNANAFSSSTSSLVFKTGYLYCYAYKARTATDQYSPVSSGGLGILPPGFYSGSPNGSQALSVPTGSADGSVSTASSTASVNGPSTGAIITVAGQGSTDPQVDTIVIFRSLDGGASMFELTEIPNPPAIGGTAQPWTFQDFLPDTASGNFPGLNTLVFAPINHSNDPIPKGAVNLVQYFGRIFFSIGATVYCTQGPAVGGSSQPPGNGYTCSNPGQFFTFPSPVIRLVPTTMGLLVFTASDLGIISGGPSISTMFPNIYVQGLGLTSYNALTVRGGLIDLFTADSQIVSLDPNMGISKVGYPIGDQFFKYGSQTTTFNPGTAYVTFHTQGLNDEALFVADGSTGWFRGVTNLAPDAAISGPVWSPKATVVGGCKAIASLEIAPGQHALLLGATTANQPILVRDSTYTTFSDNGSAYPSNFTFGSMVLANPGQQAEVGFITCEFQKIGTSPKLAVMLDEIADSVMVITAASQSGNNTTYTYTLTTGFPVVVGSGVTVSGMADSGNNGTFTVTAVGGGTFTVVNPSGVTHAGQTGAGTLFEDLSGDVLQDAPLKYGRTLAPASTYSNRYNLAQSINGVAPPQGVMCRHMQVRIDFGSTDVVQNELLTQTIWGKHWQEV